MDDGTLALSYATEEEQIEASRRVMRESAQVRFLQRNAVELARRQTRHAIAVLTRGLRSADERIRIAAAIALLDRGHGRPAQNVRLDVEQRQVTINIDLTSADAQRQREGAEIAEAIAQTPLPSGS